MRQISLKVHSEETVTNKFIIRKNRLKLVQSCYSGVFGVAEHEYHNLEGVRGT